LLILAAVAFASGAGPSDVKQIWIYSFFRFSALAALGAIGVYLIWSLRYRRLMIWNTVSALVLLSVIVSLEAGLRLLPGILSDDLLILLPETAQRDIADSRGLFSKSNLRGEQMLYSYTKGFSLLRQPWVRIDEDGYRNPAIPSTSANVILLGDSVMIAQSAKKDLGDRFREIGLSAVNFGFGGYGLYQYRDVYRRHVIDRGLSHEWVIVMITFQNDLKNSLDYLAVKKSGGDWRNYLGRPTSYGWPEWLDGKFVPRSISVLMKLPFVLRNRSVNTDDKLKLHTPRGILPANSGTLWAPDLVHGIREQRAVETPIRDIVEQANRVGAKVVLAFVPNSGLIYGIYAKGHEAKFNILENNRNQFVSFLKHRFSGDGVNIVDLTEKIRQRAGVVPISAHRLDYHLNDKGIEIVFKELKKYVKD
jgi:hypothetical protein